MVDSTEVFENGGGFPGLLEIGENFEWMSIDTLIFLSYQNIAMQYTALLAFA